MDITCPACASRFSLPSDRIPKAAFRVACGKCKHQFSVDPTAAAAPLPAAGPALGPPPPRHSTPPRTSIPPPVPSAPRSAVTPTSPAPGDKGVKGAPVEEFQEGLQLALVCEDRPGEQAQMCAALKELGYKSHVAPGPKEALAWQYQHRYEVMLLSEVFGDGSVLGSLSALPMTQRRHLCIGLFGKDLRTMDHQTAFHNSVHFVVNERDLSRLPTIVRSAVADNESFYRVFREVLRQVGRA